MNELKAFEKKENYTLYKGDVLEILKQLPSESVDMIVTSPPYNINLKDRKDTNIATYDTWEDNMEWDEYCKWQISVCNELYRIVRWGGLCSIIIKTSSKMSNIETL